MKTFLLILFAIGVFSIVFYDTWTLIVSTIRELRKQKVTEPHFDSDKLYRTRIRVRR